MHESFAAFQQMCLSIIREGRLDRRAPGCEVFLHMRVFGVWEEVREPGENPRRQTPHRKVPGNDATTSLLTTATVVLVVVVEIKYIDV